MVSFNKILKRQAKRLQIYLFRHEKLTKILAWEGLYQFIVKGPTKFRYISQMYFLTYHNKEFREHLIAELSVDPEALQTINNRCKIKKKLTDLMHCQQGTLGYAFYHHMHDNKIKLVLPLDADVKTDFQYITHRLIVTHDIYHTILGAKTDYYGEGMVGAFTNSQINSYLPPMVHCSAGMLRCAIAEPALIDRGNLGFTRGWLLGKMSAQLFNVDWDNYWDMPLKEVRKILKVDIEKVENIIQQNYGQPSSTTFNSPTRIHDHLYNSACTYQKYALEDTESLKKNIIQIASYRPTTQPPLAIAILGRAMFTSGRYFTLHKKNTLASCLIQNGIQVIFPIINEEHEHNFEYMIENTQKYISFVKSHWPNTPIILIGHSLSGLCFLAQQGMTIPEEQIKGIVTLGAATWNREYLRQESKLYQLKLKSLTYLIKMFLFFHNHLPVKSLKYGDFNEHKEMITQIIISNMDKGKWLSSDKHIDYYENLKNIQCSVLCVASHNDFYAKPTQVQLLHSHIAGKVDVMTCDNLSHMDIGMSPNAWHIWKKIADWIKSTSAVK